MLISIGLFVLQAVSDFFIAVFLLRFYSVLIKVNIGSYLPELSKFLYALTDWLVLPLRRRLPRTGRFDASSILPAMACQLIYTGLKSFLWASQFQILQVICQGSLDLIRLAISGLIGVLFLSVILSWIQPHSSAHHLFEKLSAPVLNPIRRVVPLVGGLDLSPLVALLVLQIIEKLIASLLLSS